MIPRVNRYFSGAGLMDIGLSEAAPELIVSGQKGFYLTELCAVDDLTRAANQLDGQIKSNTRKVLAWRQIAHRRIG